MKIFFNASLAGKGKYLKEYETIIKTMTRMGHTVYSEHIISRDAEKVRKQSNEEHERDYRRVREQIEKSDVMVVEATYPSIGVGHIISIALQNYKSVLILYRSPEAPHGMLVGDPERLIFIRKYSPDQPEKLKAILEKFLDNAKKKLLNVRFNMMIDKEEEEYLDMVSRMKGISKSDFVRQLIDKSLRGEVTI